MPTTKETGPWGGGGRRGEGRKYTLLQRVHFPKVDNLILVSTPFLVMLRACVIGLKILISLPPLNRSDEKLNPIKMARFLTQKMVCSFLLGFPSAPFNVSVFF